MSSIDTHRVQGIVFDLYNTLIHITAKVDPYRRLLRELGFTYGQIERRRGDLMSQPIGDKTHMTHWLAPERPVPGYDFDHDLLVELNSCRIYPDSRSTLRHLSQRLPIFLLSNITTHYKAPFFRLGLEPYFQQVFFSCDLGFIKPDVQLFHLVQEQTGIAAENLLMVGDSPRSDYEGGRNAGMQSVLLDRTGRWNEGVRINDLETLVAWWP